MMVSNRNLLFQVSIFGCHVSFRECIFCVRVRIVECIFRANSKDKGMLGAKKGCGILTCSKCTCQKSDVRDIRSKKCVRKRTTHSSRIWFLPGFALAVAYLFLLSS